MNTERQQREAAAEFANRWKDKGYEKGESQRFWLDLLGNVYGVDKPTEFVEFEDKVQLDSTSFIDVMIPSTHVMIEQKSLNKDLRKPIKQSDGTMLTPFQQAQRYSAALPYSKRPRWIVTCNFAEFDVYDMENPNGEPQHIYLKDLGKDYYRLQFLVDIGSEHLKKEMEVSMKAGEIVGKMYDALIKQYDADDPMSLRYLNILCVRLVFCLYAEDAGIFGKHDMFHDYMEQYDTMSMRDAMMRLFDTLNTPKEKRSKYLRPDLAAFPYTNGGLFAEQIEIPQFTDEIRNTLLQHASLDFDWSQISPTIFGGVFESTLNPETRRKGGMHYTSIENIHKVIDPLFLNALKTEFAEIMEESVLKVRLRNLHVFQDKLASLVFFDPACGSGNFLTESYLSLRRLENDVIKAIYAIEPLDMYTNPIKVNINQFFGIEINDFAVTVATTALWISESQMMAETEKIVHHDIDFLPLKSYANIHEGNALTTDWNTIVPKEKLSYIIGNPPFVGARMMARGSEQKKEIETLFGNIKDVQDLDYVTGWYRKAAELIQGTHIEVGLVSTNSICQGSQVPILWNVLLNKFHIKINFAYQTFKWSSEASEKAAVHCVIIGFATFDRKQKELFINGIAPAAIVEHINPYLLPGKDILVTASKETLCNVPKMNFGNQPRDGGNFIFTDEEYVEAIKEDPGLQQWFHPYMGADEFIKGKKRWCLWLKGISPTDVRKHKLIYERIAAVKAFREASKAKTTNGYAKVPNLFAQITQPDGVDYLIIPRTSSENRRYIPIGFETSNIISSDAVQIVPNANLYHFGILTSNVHMAWMRAVCGRLEMRYRYSKEIVYNNFPWPSPTVEQRNRIEKTAQVILDIRDKYPMSSMADLYDSVSMPSDLLNAHRNNDRAVMAAYGFSTKLTESECVARLLEMYSKLIRK